LEAQKYITHLDLMRAWERIFKRAEIPVTYSEGFTARPRISFAAPLAVGVTSECEVLELYTSRRIPPSQITQSVADELPNGIEVRKAVEVPMARPSLQSMLRVASYHVVVSSDRSATEWGNAIENFLSQHEIPWKHKRGDELREYDLRPLVFSIELLENGEDVATLLLRLRNDTKGSGRPEQVTKALGIASDPIRVHRVSLEFDEPSVARSAYRATGRMSN